MDNSGIGFPPIRAIVAAGQWGVCPPGKKQGCINSWQSGKQEREGYTAIIQQRPMHHAGTVNKQQPMILNLSQSLAKITRCPSEIQQQLRTVSHCVSHWAVLWEGGQVQPPPPHHTTTAPHTLCLMRGPESLVRGGPPRKKREKSPFWDPSPVFFSGGLLLRPILSSKSKLCFT